MTPKDTASTTKTQHDNQDQDAFLQDLVELRRRLHTVPETAFEEKQTAQMIREYLKENAGLEPVAEGIAETGLLYRLEGGKDGPKILLEADLDALPLTEDTGKDYASKNKGRHHACGHDGHMAMLAGALVRLSEQAQKMPGELYALFQPAEETGEGAEKTLEDPRLSGLDLDRVYVIHNLPGHPLGTIVIREGAMASASVGLHFHFEGETSHAAAPHKGKSAVPAISQLAIKAPTAPSAVLPYGRPGLVTTIHLEAGKIAYGTAAGSGDARFTVRGARDDELRLIKERLIQYAEGLAASHGLRLEVEEVEPFPATINDPDAVKAVEGTAKRLGLSLHRPGSAQAWSEDFGHYNTRWPGALICMGSGEDQPELHRPDFDFPDDLLSTGVAFWVNLIVEADHKRNSADGDNKA